MSTLLKYISHFGRRKHLLSGLVLLVFVFLSCAYFATETQSDNMIRAEKLVGFHKKLQQVDFEPVRFLPVKSSSASSFQSSADTADANQESIESFRKQAAAIQDISDDDNIEYDHETVHDIIQPPKQRLNNQFAPVYYPPHDQRLQPGLNHDNLPAAKPKTSEPYIPEHRIIHFDLKGAPPSMAYMKKVVIMSKRLGATGVLMEYEDMFPWSGRLQLTAHSQHYSLEEVKEFVEFCEKLGLEVIPLVQTFGHLEYVLKHKEFSYLRDVAEMPESICPCHQDTMGLIREIIDQVMAVHTKASYLHIGCDEVYHLGECQQCQVNMTGRNEIFTNHVTNVAKYAKDTYSVTPIIWDDMLRNLIVEEMMVLADLVEPMVWVYAPDVERFAPSYTWDRFNQVFPNIWTASAFKGAHGETLVTPDIKKHLENNLNWLTLMREEEPRLQGKFRGIVLTGWQRYDHFSVLCELLPAALPSLAVNLLATSHGYFNDSMKTDLMKELNCPDPSQSFNNNYGGKFFDLDYDRFLFQKLSWCYFPGQKFYKVTQDLISTEETVDNFVKTATKSKGWLTQYNIRHNMSSPFRIDQVLEEWSRTNHLVISLMRQANTALLEMFDEFTAAEWIEQKVYPMFSTLSKIRTQADELKRIKYWPSRPYPPLEALTDMGIGVPTSSSTTKKPKTYGNAANKNYVDINRGYRGGGSKVYNRPDSQNNIVSNTNFAHNKLDLNNNNYHRVAPHQDQIKIGAGSSQYVPISNNL